MKIENLIKQRSGYMTENWVIPKLTCVNNEILPVGYF